MRQEF